MTIDIKPVTQIIGEAAKQSKDRKPITKADVNNAIKALQRLGEENNSIIYRLNYLERAIKNISSITIEPSMPVFINSYELQGGNGLSLSIDTINKIININVGQGDGVIVSANSVEVDCTDLLGDGIDEDENNNFMVDCTDLLGWGIKEVNNNFTLDASINPTWTGNHIFEGTITLKTNIMPGSPDTYDIGSPTAIWRKAYISELEALIFAENTIFPIGGWFMITKDQGSLPTEMSDSQTTYDFGKTMTPNDFLVFRAAGVVEYIQIGSLVSGTTYNITRNLDGTGANTWAAGSTWACLGYNGNGRIELNAYDTPRINLLTQGTTYNSQTELLRLGDLNGNWGYTSSTYGLAIGEYGSGKVNLTIDPTNGYRLRTYSTNQFQVTPNLLKFGADVSSASSTAITIFGADQTYNSESVGTGDLLIGDNSSNKANILWDKSTGKLLFRGGTTTQITIDTNGALKAGGDIVTLNSEGISIEILPDSWIDAYLYGYKHNNSLVAGLYGKYTTDPDVVDSGIKVHTEEIAQLVLDAMSTTGGNPANITLDSYKDGTAYIFLRADLTYLYNEFLINANSTTALLVEDSGTKDNVLVVNTTNGRVGVNCAPSYALHLVGQFYTNIKSTTALLVEQNGVKDNVLVVNTTNGRVGVNGTPIGTFHVYSTAQDQIYLSDGNIDNAGNYGLAIRNDRENGVVYEDFHTKAAGAALASLIFRGGHGSSETGYTRNLMTIKTDTGRIGLGGDSAPGEILDVNGNINCTGVIKIDDMQVLRERYIDSAINNWAADSYNNATKNLINCLKNMALHHQMVAAS